jgi:hypothetical protein
VDLGRSASNEQSIVSYSEYDNDEAEFTTYGAMSRYPSRFQEVDERHYRLLQKEAGRIAPSAVGAYIRWNNRIVSSQQSGQTLEFSLKSFDSWAHGEHLAATPMLSGMVRCSTRRLGC